MSTPSNIVFFGIRINLAAEDIPSIETRKHPLNVRARESGLQTYFGNFGDIYPLYYLLVGKVIGKTGPENKDAVELSSDELFQIISQVQEKLQAAKFDIAPKLYTMWIPDA